MNAVALLASASLPVILDFQAARDAAAKAKPELLAKAEDRAAAGKKQGGIKDIAVGRSDEFRVSFFDLHIKPDWNSRDLDNPENIAHIEWLGENIAENGVLDALEVVFEDGKLWIVDGHCRYFGTARAINVHGASIESLPVKTVPKGANEIDRLLSQELRNSGKQLAPLERSRLYVKLLKLGVSEADIARRVSKSVTYVNQLLTLASAPVEVQNLVQTGAVSATLAIQTVKASGSEAEAVKALKDGVADAAAKGKTKATAKNVERAKGTVKAKPSTADRDALDVIRDAFQNAEREPGSDKTSVVFDNADLLKVLAALGL